jgi:hypothetical protein
MTGGPGLGAKAPEIAPVKELQALFSKALVLNTVRPVSTAVARFFVASLGLIARLAASPIVAAVCPALEVIYVDPDWISWPSATLWLLINIARLILDIGLCLCPASGREHQYPLFSVSQFHPAKASDPVPDFGI